MPREAVSCPVRLVAWSQMQPAIEAPPEAAMAASVTMHATKAHYELAQRNDIPKLRVRLPVSTPLRQILFYGLQHTFTFQGGVRGPEVSKNFRAFLLEMWHVSVQIPSAHGPRFCRLNVLKIDSKAAKGAFIENVDLKMFPPLD